LADVREIALPALGETIAEATVTTWLRRVGDKVEKGEPLLEVSTDKVDAEVVATASGVLVEILVGPGEIVAVGAPLARIRSESRAPIVPQPPDITAPVAASLAVSPLALPEAGEPVVPAPRSFPGSLPIERRLLSPRVRRLIDERGFDPDVLVATGGRGRLTADDVMTSTAPEGSTRQAASPARRIDAPAAPNVAVAQSTSAAAPWLSVDVDCGPIAAAAPTGLPVLAFVARAVVSALRRHPDANATFDGETVSVHRAVHLALDAVVVPDAQDMRLRAVADALTRPGRDTDRPATVAVTELAPGLAAGLPAPSGPAVARLAIGAALRRPVAITDGGGDALAVRPVRTLTMSWEPSALDVRSAGLFLLAVKEALERTDWRVELA
jgi:pyruvate dehydrogenase E2 component (dihydrolipoamide acetyltransferase)